MVAKTYYATKDMRHPIYRTRMLKAGDEMDISGPLGPAFAKMGLITDVKPKRVKAPAAEEVRVTNEVKVADVPKPVAKPAPKRKRAAKKK